MIFRSALSCMLLEKSRRDHTKGSEREDEKELSTQSLAETRLLTSLHMNPKHWMKQFILRAIHSKLMQLVPKWNAINNNFPFYNASEYCAVLNGKSSWMPSEEVDVEEADKWIFIYCWSKKRMKKIIAK